MGLGGNALRHDVATAVESIADLAADHDVVVTHGKTPQGPIARRLEQGLSAALAGREVAAVHLHSVVDAAELRTIRWLMAEGALVICGGGSAPVIVDTAAPAAAVDHDLATALLAACLGAEALLMLTDVDAVERDWGTPARAGPAPGHARGPAEHGLRGRLDAAQGPRRVPVRRGHGRPRGHRRAGRRAGAARRTLRNHRADDPRPAVGRLRRGPPPAAPRPGRGRAIARRVAAGRLSV